MRQRLLLVGVLVCSPALIVAAGGGGCANTVTEVAGTAGGGGGGDAGAGGSSILPFGGGGSWPDGGYVDAAPDYIDPGCPDSGPKITMFKCDPFSQNNGDCPKGQGCYIYVQYPMDPCAKEIYGSTCAKVGPGTQGSACGGSQNCAAGFTCVVSGSGNQCVALCPLMGADGCKGGTVCEPIDVEGFGGCL